MMKKAPKMRHQDECSQEGGKKLHAASFSIGVNVFLIILKAAVSLVTGSIAILAELAHSFFDMLASLFAYAGIRKADKPADRTHLYGHEKFENLSSFAQTILIAITSVLIVYESIMRIISPTKIEATELGLIVMVMTIAIDYFVSRYLHRTSRKYGSPALEADAYHFTTDLWGAVAVIIGLALVIAGFPVFDSIAAIAVSVLMLWISYKLGRKSVNALMDRSPSEEKMERIGNAIAATRDVRRFHKLKARQAGNKLIIEVHVQLLPHLTLRKGHYISHRVKRRLMKEFPEIKEVTIHVEPDLRENGE
jgi:cation diffusion facilitator family transporter